MNNFITIKGANEHNLKSINLKIPKNKLTVITGVSGSGKSSLAFDTIYAEGQRRYVESMSPYARQFLEIHKKPDVQSIDGLAPAIAIDQKSTSKNTRSTVATATEIYDYLRLLFARIGIPYSPTTNLPIQKQSFSRIIEIIMSLPRSTNINILAPISRGQRGEHRNKLLFFKKNSYQYVKINGIYYNLKETLILDKNKKNNIEILIDTLSINDTTKEQLLHSVKHALKIGSGVIYIEINHKNALALNENILMLSNNFACPVSDFSLPEIEPRIFSFNSPFGACKMCNGLGKQMIFDEKLIIPDNSLSIQDNAIAPWQKKYAFSGTAEKSNTSMISALAKHYKFNLSTPYKQLSAEIKTILLYGNDQPIAYSYVNGYRTQHAVKTFKGIIPMLEEKLCQTESNNVIEEIRKYQKKVDCRECNGFRINKSSLCIKINLKHIGDVCKMNIHTTLSWILSLKNILTQTQLTISTLIIKELSKRLKFLIDVGLGYLTLSRASNTLSGGEHQRIRLASQIASGLTGILYILDEPSIGLHQSDTNKLIHSLKSLRDLGNTIIIVEHDEETMLQADYIVDMGKYAGIHGGEIIAHGLPHEIIQNKKSLTGLYLSGTLSIQVPQRKRYLNKNKIIKITGIKTNNLKNIDIDIPISNLTTITGVSGSGKSSLALQTFYNIAINKLSNNKILSAVYKNISGLEFIDKIIQIDQRPIGRTPRSNPATYIAAFTSIRDLFSSLTEARNRGYTSGRFSFNVKGGRCENCEGGGLIKVAMHFLPDIYINCDKCRGMRYNEETLEICYKEKNIANVLDMTVNQSVKFFNNIPLIYDRLITLEEVGLGYITIGQAATTLSGGEAQRIKLAKELSKKSTGRTLYILDEPTTGLHAYDIQKLLHILHKLVDRGNTVVIIEHNLDVIKTSDYIIDIGPGAGIDGGHIVAKGTPKEVSESIQSITGQYLKKKLPSIIL